MKVMKRASNASCAQAGRRNDASRRCIPDHRVPARVPARARRAVGYDDGRGQGTGELRRSAYVRASAVGGRHRVAGATIASVKPPTEAFMTDVSTLDDRRDSLVSPRPGPLGRLAGVAFRRRGRVVLGWIAALAVAIGLSAAFAGDFSADYSTPGSDSRQAQDLLEDRFPARS